MKYTNVIEYTPTHNYFTYEYSYEAHKDYTIIGRCFSGSRHYSEKMTYETMVKEYPKYAAMIQYFGGGELQVLYQGDILKEELIF